MILLRRSTFWMAVIGITATVLLVLRMHAQLVEPAPSPPLAPPTKPYVRAVAASGLVEARNENTNIGVPVAGLLSQINVKVWDRVKKGDVLLSLDDRELRADLISERAQVTVAAATEARVQDQLSRMESVQDPRAVSIDDLKTRRGDVAVALAQREAATAAVDQTEALLDRLTVRAPIDGTILQVNNRAGEYLVPGAATPPIVLGNIDEVQVRADVDEQIAPRVRPGRDAIGFLKGETKNPIPMTFVRIEPFVIPKVSLTGSSEERVDTRVLQVIFRFANPGQSPIYVGQQMDIYINDGPSVP